MYVCMMCVCICMYVCMYMCMCVEELIFLVVTSLSILSVLPDCSNYSPL